MVGLFGAAFGVVDEEVVEGGEGGGLGVAGGGGADGRGVRAGGFGAEEGDGVVVGASGGEC